MQGQHNHQPELFAEINIENLIPRNHLLRRIDKILDLGFVRELTASFYSDSQGRPSIDPEIFVRMILVEYFYNIESDRQLCEELQYNLAYRWFCKFSMKDKIPDHSSMTRIRDRLGEETFKKIFHHIVELCRSKGLVKGERIMMDGSLMKANASLYSMVERNPENKKEDDKNDDDKTPPSGALRESKDGLSNNDLRKNSIVGIKISNEKHMSKTDPDATLSGKSHEHKSLQYKTHYAADAGSRVILDCHVTTGAVSETKVFQERVEFIEKEFSVRIKEVIADRGYGSSYNLRYLDRRNINSNIPLWSTRSGETFFKELANGFQYDPVLMKAKCPMGYRMHITHWNQETERSTYSLPGAICKSCPRRETCLTEGEKNQNRGKRFAVPDNYKIYEKTLEKHKTLEFKMKLRERMWKIEGLFAEAKLLHGMRRARYRRRWKVQMQIYMTASVQNLKRLAEASFSDLISILRIFLKNDFLMFNPV